MMRPAHSCAEIPETYLRQPMDRVFDTKESRNLSWKTFGGTRFCLRAKSKASPRLFIASYRHSSE